MQKTAPNLQIWRQKHAFHAKSGPKLEFLRFEFLSQNRYLRTAGNVGLTR